MIVKMMPFAFVLNEDILSLLIPLMALLIPIVAILTRHQQRMTELIREQNQPVASPELAAMRDEIKALKDIVHQQAIALDSASPRMTPPAAPVIDNSLQDRLHP